MPGILGRCIESAHQYFSSSKGFLAVPEGHSPKMVTGKFHTLLDDAFEQNSNTALARAMSHYEPPAQREWSLAANKSPMVQFSLGALEYYFSRERHSCPTEILLDLMSSAGPDALSQSNTLLQLAIIHGTVDDVKNLVNKGVKIRHDGWPAMFFPGDFMLAVQHSQFETAKYLASIGYFSPLLLPVLYWQTLYGEAHRSIVNSMLSLVPVEYQYEVVERVALQRILPLDHSYLLDMQNLGWELSAHDYWGRSIFKRFTIAIETALQVAADTEDEIALKEKRLFFTDGLHLQGFHRDKNLTAQVDLFLQKLHTTKYSPKVSQLRDRILLGFKSTQN